MLSNPFDEFHDILFRFLHKKEILCFRELLLIITDMKLLGDWNSGRIKLGVLLGILQRMNPSIM